MARSLVWFYAFVGLAFFSGTLGLLDPVLAAAPFGFSAILLCVLIVALFLDWLMAKAWRGRKWLTLPLALFAVFLVFGAIGEAGWGLFGLLVTAAVFASIRR